MAETIRTFIAVKISVARELRRVLNRLASYGSPVRSVSADNVHVTLKFLGDTEASLTTAIEEQMRSVVNHCPAFSMHLVGLGAFPHAGRPSVVWAGLQNAEPLTQIAADLEHQLQALGFAKDQRPFRPHVTLARIKRKPPDDLKTLLHTHESTDFGQTRVDSVELLQSDLQREGPRYTVLASAALLGP